MQKTPITELGNRLVYSMCAQERRFTTAQLARYFYLDAADLSWICQRRDLYLQMGLAVQLGTVRFLGTFLEKPLTVPECVITFIAEQLGYADVSGLALYAESETRFDHKIQIRERDGYRDFSDPFEQSDTSSRSRRSSASRR